MTRRPSGDQPAGHDPLSVVVVAVLAASTQVSLCSALRETILLAPPLDLLIVTATPGPVAVQCATSTP